MQRPRRMALVLCLAALFFAACDAGTGPNTQPTATPPGRVVFGAEDGVVLEGQLFGHGTTAVVFSNGFGAVKESWLPVPQELAARGYLALIYDYRGTGASRGSASPNEPDARDRDLRAAVSLVRSRGATSVALIGASYGGLLSAKLAGPLHASALVVLSSPLSSGSLSLSDDELRALAMPKLFLVSQGDTDFVGDVQHMDDVAPPPKEIEVYPGAQHGSSILTGANPDADALPRLVAFLQQYAPAGSRSAPAGRASAGRTCPTEPVTPHVAGACPDPLRSGSHLRR